MLNRRRLLTIGAVVAGGAVVLPTGSTSSAGADNVSRMRELLAPNLGTGHLAGLPAGTAFTVPMPIPPVLRQSGFDPARDVYTLNVAQANVELLPGLSTAALTYGGQFVGPTIRARVGRPVRVTFTNQYSEAIATHLHGSHTPADSDGYPMDLVQPGASRVYDYPNTQQGTMLWYHDHAMGKEAEHVYRGLHGMYLLQDDSENHLGLPSGPYDIPILLRDVQLDDTGALVYSSPDGRTTILVNGKVQPYFPVAARKYRLRFLNAANERIFKLDIGGGEIVQIGSDGGLLPAPVSRTEIVLGSAERADVVIDFSRYPVGSQVMLSDVTGQLLRFDVVRTAPDNSQVPDQLRALPALPPATQTRQVSMMFDLSGAMPVGMINGAAFDPNVVNYQIKRGTTEIWEITNADGANGFDHSFHMHLVQFRVLDRQGSPMLPDDAGLKDTINVPPGTTVRVQASFRDYLGRYVFHCHYLEHSALGMMGQFEVVA